MVAGGAAVNISTSTVGRRSAFSYVKLNPAALDRLLLSEAGPVARDLLERGERVKIRAKQLVGVSKPDPVPRAHPRRPGNLRDHIYKRMSIAKGRLRVEVGADVPYAFFHHEGWKGGIIIYPKHAKFLVFYWEKAKTFRTPGGRLKYPDGIVYAKSVRQGSFKGNKFLNKALEAAK